MYSISSTLHFTRRIIIVTYVIVLTLTSTLIPYYFASQSFLPR